MKPIARFIDRLFFAPTSAAGFGLMRIGFGAVTFFSVFFIWPTRQIFFSETGIFPLALTGGVLRWTTRFSLVDGLHTESDITAYFILLLVVSFLCAVGTLPRLTTILTTVLLYSLQEHNPFIFAGGDTLLRLIGFILVVSPSLDAFSLKRLRQRMKQPKKRFGELLVPAYAYRLLLWQMLILYGTSLWEKLLGTMWMKGTAVEAVLHHPMFTRMPIGLLNLLTPLTPYASLGVLLFHSLWLLLLVPKELTTKLPPWIPKIRLKRALLCLGLIFHGSILLMLDAGNFSLVVFVAYLGLLDQDDIAVFKRLWNWRWKGKIDVLYDGDCGFCLRTKAFLDAADWADRIHFANFLDEDERKKYGHGIALSSLDRSLHIALPDGKILKGFDAFRELCEHLPPLLPLVLVLWLPGVDIIGRKIYASVAAKRKKCTHENCGI